VALGNWLRGLGTRHGHYGKDDGRESREGTRAYARNASHRLSWQEWAGISGYKRSQPGDLGPKGDPRKEATRDSTLLQRSEITSMTAGQAEP